MLGKNMLTYYKSSWISFPPYLMGSSSYLISGKAIISLIAAAQVTPFCQPNGSIDDVYVTGILTQIPIVTFTIGIFKLLKRSIKIF
jgi:hypothetical protein